MVAVTNTDAYSFLTFSDLTRQHGDTVIGFFLCTLPPDIRETKLGGLATKGLHHYQVKIPG